MQVYIGEMKNSIFMLEENWGSLGESLSRRQMKI
jgi:hypothetical protein